MLSELDARTRHLVVFTAVFAGKCALFDTETSFLTPFDLKRKG
jgi:hypothetical protein